MIDHSLGALNDKKCHLRHSNSDLAVGGGRARVGPEVRGVALRVLDSLVTQHSALNSDRKVVEAALGRERPAGHLAEDEPLCKGEVWVTLTGSAAITEYAQHPCSE